MLTIAPIKREPAKAWARAVHRHLPPPVGDLCRVALLRDGVIVGVGFAGRPVARALDDGETAEITRVAVLEGVDCGCSRIYGALRRALVALGYRRIYTYTLETEPGTSLRASGWTCEGPAGGGQWSTPARVRRASPSDGRKVRWIWRAP